MFGRRWLPAAMDHWAGTALCPAVLHVFVYGYRFQPSLGYVSLVFLCVYCFVRLCTSFPFVLTLAVVIIHLFRYRLVTSTGNKERYPPLKYSLLPWRGTFAQRRALSNPILTEAVDGLVLQRCRCLARGLSASTPKPMSIGSQQKKGTNHAVHSVTSAVSSTVFVAVFRT